MAIRRFEVLLTHEDRYGVELETERDHITRFTVRYDAYIKDACRTIVIFDNHGGQAHQHLMDPITGKGVPHVIHLDLDEAETYAISRIQAMWEGWRERYEQRV